jgi:hypothetical protein
MIGAERREREKREREKSERYLLLTPPVPPL